MKLYANVSSERATKGQGGNKYIDVVLQVEHPAGWRQVIGKIALTAGNKDNQFFNLVFIDENGKQTTIRTVKHLLK